MNDPLRAKLNLIATAILAFGIGLGVAARFDLTPPGYAGGVNPPLRLEASPSPLQALPPSGFAEIADRITPAVVTIFVYKDIPAHQRPRVPEPFEQFFPNDPPSTVRGSGSGFVISDDGYIVTNNHVVEGATRIEVEFTDRRVFRDVQLVGADATTDVALLRIEDADVTPAPLGSSAEARVGEWVLAVGSPGFSAGSEPLTTTVTAGIISAKGRNINIIGQDIARRTGQNLAIEDFIQTDAAINPGNSGGPLVNARGEVIGVNAAIASRSGVNEGYGFAVPIDLVREVVEDLVEYGHVRRALLGVSIQGVDDAIARDYGLDKVIGAQVRGVEEGSAADAAGVKVGDVIVAIDGREVGSVSELQRLIRSYEPGETVRVQLVDYDSRRRRTVAVELDEAQSLEEMASAREAVSEAADLLGVRVEELDAQARRALDLPDDLDGVVVVEMRQAGPFAARWSRLSPAENPVIRSVNRQPVRSLRDYRRALADVQPGDVVSLVVYDPATGVEAPVSVPLPAPTR
ncbi:MAG: trypsin-like peptidase domain-containing protein [Gemmatimonadota bacterium]|nr:trypsin-like peptidase domain-containing protein [Gemmatimonadota bacterium]